jgi:hypothetical protein
MSSTTPSEISAPPPQPAVTRGGYGTTALVLGLVAIAAMSTGILIPLALAAGILAIVFGVLGRRRAGRGEAADGVKALSGLILGALATVLSITAIVLFLSAGVGRFGVGFDGGRFGGAGAEGAGRFGWDRWEQNAHGWWNSGEVTEDGSDEGADAPAS